MPRSSASAPGSNPTKARSAVVLINMRSRRGKDWLRPVKEALDRSETNVKAFHAIRDPKRLTPLLRQAVKDGADMIVVGGGDGSMSAAAAELRGSQIILGVLPLGTGNALARDLGIPSQVEKACAVLTEGAPTSIDLGMANDDLFVNVVTCGLTTRVAEHLTDEAKRKLGRMVYAVALLRALALVRPFKVSVETPEGKTSFDSLQVVVGNGRYHAGPFPLSPTASIADGKLEVYALDSTKRSALLKMVVPMLVGRHVELPNVWAASVAEGRVVALPARRLTIDGEIVRRTPFSFKSLPGVLRVMAPADFEA